MSLLLLFAGAGIGTTPIPPVIIPPEPRVAVNAGGAGAPAFPRRRSVRELYRPLKPKRDEPEQQAVEVAGTVITPDAVAGMSPLPVLMDFGNGPVMAGLRAPSLSEALRRMNEQDEEEAITAILIL